MADLEGWGVSPWGFGAWGAAAPFTLVGAWPLGTHWVRVRLSQEPAHVNPFVPSDVLCVESWLLTKSVKNVDVRIPLIGVKATSALNEWDLFTLYPLNDFYTTHTLTAVNLVSAAQIPLIPPRSVSFRGIREERHLDPQMDPRGVIDIKNESWLGGEGYQVQGAGYEVHSRADALKKRLFRRLTGPWPNTPNFGLGIRSKEVLRNGLPDLESRIEEQVLLDSEVVSVRARGRFSGETGLLVITLIVEARFGRVDFGIRGVTGSETFEIV